MLNAIGINIASVNGWIMANTAGANLTTGANDGGQTNADPVIPKASAEVDQFLSLWAVQNLTASDARSNGPASNWPTQNGQAPMAASVLPATLWFGSLRPSKASNHSSLDEATSPADNAVADSPVDDPATTSSAS